jgi:AcrR family transcriptional regulator
MKKVRPTRKVVGSRQWEGRADILEAAASFIARQGFHGMGMRDLAKATGKALASLYNYFDSKEEMLFALQSGAFEALIDSAERVVAEADEPAAKLYSFIANHVAYVAQHTDVMRVLVAEATALPSAQRRKVRLLKEKYFAVGRALVAGLVEDSDPRAQEMEVERATYTIFGMLNWVYAWYEPARHGTPFDVARTIHKLCMSGLVAKNPIRFNPEGVEMRLAAHPPESLIRTQPSHGESP